MIWVITKFRASDGETRVDSVKTTAEKATVYISAKNRNQGEWFYQAQEMEIT